MNWLMRSVLTLIVMLMVNALPADSARGGSGGHGGGGHGGYHSHSGGSVHFGLYVGPGWWGGPYSYYPYYYPYYYPPAPVIIQPSPEIHIEQAPAPEAEESRYWYYCQKPQGYYPYVKKCPKGWMKVVPPDSPSEEPAEEE